MLRYRVTTRGPEVSMMIFTSAEALFVWHNEPDSDIESEDVIDIDLRPEDYMDIEWLGCEIVHQGAGFTTLNLINVAFARGTDNGSGHVIETFTGWVSDQILPVKDLTTQSLTIRKLDDEEGLKAPHPSE